MTVMLMISVVVRALYRSVSQGYYSAAGHHMLGVNRRHVLLYLPQAQSSIISALNELHCLGQMSRCGAGRRLVCAWREGMFWRAHCQKGRSFPFVSFLQWTSEHSYMSSTDVGLIGWRWGGALFQEKQRWCHWSWSEVESLSSGVFDMLMWIFLMKNKKGIKRSATLYA